MQDEVSRRVSPTLPTPAASPQLAHAGRPTTRTVTSPRPVTLLTRPIAYVDSWFGLPLQASWCPQAPSAQGFNLWGFSHAPPTRQVTHLPTPISANEVKVKEGTLPGNKTILLSLVKDATIQANGYKLQISATGVTIKANEPAGIFYGVQTLLQLFPDEVEEKKMRKSPTEWEIPLLTK